MSKQGETVYTLYNQLISSFSASESDSIIHRTSLFVNRDSQTIQRRHQAKFHKLLQQQRIASTSSGTISNGSVVSKISTRQPHLHTNTSKTEHYVNLSHFIPSPAQKEALSISPKFALPASIQPINQLIPLYEQAIKSFPFSKQYQARKLVHSYLSSRHFQEQTPRHHKLLKTIFDIKNNNPIHIISADKSNQLVILDTEDYLKKADACLKDLNAKTINKDPTNSLIIKVSNLKKDKNLPNEILKNCYPPIYPKIPKLFFVIKLHKPSQPLRPLVARYSSPTYNLEKAINIYLQPFFNQYHHTIKSSYDCKKILLQTNLPKKCSLRTMDAVNLFPSTPTDLAKDLILEKLSLNNIPSAVITSISRALNLILQNIFFSFNHIIYRQTTGTPMGMALSPLLAETVLQFIENQTFLYTPAPSIYLRYVDDILLISDQDHDNFDSLFQQINQILPTIKFTYNSPSNNSISFLDMIISIKDSTPHINIYHKPSSSATIIPFDSNHPNQHKWAYFNSLIYRAINLPTKTAFTRKELHLLKETAISYNYPIHQVQQIINYNYRKLHRPLINTSTSATSPKAKYIPLPYIEHLDQPLKKLLRGSTTKLAYNQATTINMLIKKDRQPSPPTGGVYLIPLQNSNKIYIGRTKRSLHKRIKEHQYNIKSGIGTTALSEFVAAHNIFPDFNNAKILSSPSNSFLLNFREAIEIFTHKNIAINHNSAIILDQAWKDLLEKYSIVH